MPAILSKSRRDNALLRNAAQSFDLLRIGSARAMRQWSAMDHDPRGRAECRRQATRTSLTGITFVRRLDPDSTARQCLAKKDLDLGVDASQVACGAPFHRLKNRFLRPERKGNAFRARGPSSLGHDRS
jgi:hypothetical protein